MRILLDTNIVLRMANRGAAGSQNITSAIRQRYARGDEFFVVPQCIYEMWSVMTRPAEASNGLDFSPEEAALEVERLLTLIPLLPDPPHLFSRWLNLVSTHAVSGRPSHDARIAAAVQAHGLDALLTLNAPHFQRFGLTVLTPADL